MEIYLTIVIVASAIALIGFPLLVAGSNALTGYDMAGAPGARAGFKEIYWQAQLAGVLIAAVIWLIYGGVLFFVPLFS